MLLIILFPRALHTADAAGIKIMKHKQRLTESHSLRRVGPATPLREGPPAPAQAPPRPAPPLASHSAQRKALARGHSAALCSQPCPSAPASPGPASYDTAPVNFRPLARNLFPVNPAYGSPSLPPRACWYCHGQKLHTTPKHVGGKGWRSMSKYLPIVSS